MAKIKYNGVLEAVRVDKNEQVLLAKIYEKRGVVWSDQFLVDREALINRIKKGQVFMVGVRQYKMGSSFDIKEPVRLLSLDGKEYIHIDQESSPGDSLKDLPRF